jgi:hypothetical protein
VVRVCIVIVVITTTHHIRCITIDHSPLQISLTDKHKIYKVPYNKYL